MAQRLHFHSKEKISFLHSPTSVGLEATPVPNKVLCEREVLPSIKAKS